MINIEYLSIITLIKGNKVTRFINLTPHTINEVNSKLSFEPSGMVARVSSEYKEIDRVNETPIYKVEFGEVVDLPEPESDTVYIVSGMVLDAVKYRNDLVAPGQLVRDSNGQPIGCNGFRK
jgi:hypothetical protein